MSKTCKKCNAEFEVLEKDREFYEQMDVPEPTFCPDCRAQRRFSFRNQSNLYKRKCDATGENMISLYSPDKPHKVYKEEVWWSDKWDPMDYGQDFDFDRPFFEQFEELMLAVPRRGMHQDGTNENCEYITFGMNNKNCYLVFAPFAAEDSCYSSLIAMCQDVFDCHICTESQLLYECTDCGKCYNCIYCDDCSECRDSYLLDNCRNCSNCVCCKNLRNKEYHIYNKPVSKEGFEKFKEGLLIGRRELLAEKKRFDEWKLELPFADVRAKNGENCYGDYIDNAKDCYYSFDVLWGAENCNYCQTCGWQGKDIWDCGNTGKESQMVYEMHASVTSHKCAFCTFFRGGNDCYYCDCMDSVNDCFGCIGLRHKKYCILNKQYSKEEYEELKGRIIEHMKKTGEWGEFFPTEISPFAFNETYSHELYPLPKEEVLKRGRKWRDEDEAEYRKATCELPDGIDGVVDSIVDEVLACEKCGKNYKFIPQELKFYKKMSLPLPERCFECRRKRRIAVRNPYKLYDRKCGKCDAKIHTSYSPKRPEKVYCKQCYLAEVY